MPRLTKACDIPDRATPVWRMEESSRHKVTRKSGVSGMSDEDATRMLATCPQQVVRVGSWNLENNTTHGQMGSTTSQQTAGRQSGKRLAS